MQVVNVIYSWISFKILNRYFLLYQDFLSQIQTTYMAAGKGKGPSYSTLPLPPTHEHLDIYLQLCMLDNYRIFLIALLAFDEIYYLTKLPFDWLIIVMIIFVCLLDDSSFCYSNLTQKTSGLELILTIMLILHANQIVVVTNLNVTPVAALKLTFYEV